MKQIILFVVLTGIAQFAMSQNANNNAVKISPDTSTYANTKLTYKIIDAPNHTFCYDVYADGRLMIHQTSIPAIPGNDGFKTKADAQKVAQLVIEKIKKGEMPPTVSIDELPACR